MSGKRGKSSGALDAPGSGPPKNTNAVTHGVHHFLATGNLPAEVRPQVDAFVSEWDQAISKRFRDEPIPLLVRCLRETAISNFAVACLRARWAGQPDLTPAVRNHFIEGALE